MAPKAVKKYYYFFINNGYYFPSRLLIFLKTLQVYSLINIGHIIIYGYLLVLLDLFYYFTPLLYLILIVKNCRLDVSHIQTNLNAIRGKNFLWQIINLYVTSFSLSLARSLSLSFSVALTLFLSHINSSLVLTNDQLLL